MTTPTTIITPRYVNGDALLLAGIEEHYNSDTMGNIPAQWMKFAPYIREVTYGVLSNSGGESWDYMAAIEIADASALPAGLTTKAIPALKYAVFTHEGSVSTMCETFAAIFQNWLPASGHTLPGDIDSFERYGEQFDPTTGTGDIEIWVPVNV